jgi:ATP-dependent DNA helicase RecQ
VPEPVTNTPPSRAEIRRVAREALGHERLRPGQAEAVAAITSGRDTLAILPTGGGKSAVYQLAGLEIDGPTVVVSPLIALQHDQVATLHGLGLGAAALSSAIGEVGRERALAAFGRDELEFLLLAPEQLAAAETLDRLRDARPSLFVVDEAHCISEWGPDFRPEYTRLGDAAEALGRPRILALTATASPPVRDEIVERLGMRDPVVVARGFDRPNIALVVATFADDRAKRRALVERTVEAAADGASGIVYTATRRAAEEVAARLVETGVAAAAYHAGLRPKRRDEAQDAFMAGDVAVVVATIAFGMGVDKPHVRFVHHLDVSDSLDAYHQEIGRAGRDGEPATAVLFFRSDDLGLRRFQAALPGFEERDVRAVLRMLRRSADQSPVVADIARHAKRSRRKTEAIVARLVDLGAARHGIGDDVALVDEQPEDLAYRAVELQERRRRIDRTRVDMVRAYAEASGCRRRVLLNYFGQPLDEPCGNCDRCWAGAGEAGFVRSVAANERVESAGAEPFELNDRVVHLTFGPGLVSGVEDGRITVLFDDSGYRTLDLMAVVTDGLLAHET